MCEHIIKCFILDCTLTDVLHMSKLNFNELSNLPNLHYVIILGLTFLPRQIDLKLRRTVKTSTHNKYQTNKQLKGVKKAHFEDDCKTRMNIK